MNCGSSRLSAPELTLKMHSRLSAHQMTLKMHTKARASSRVKVYCCNRGLELQLTKGMLKAHSMGPCRKLRESQTGEVETRLSIQARNDSWVCIHGKKQAEGDKVGSEYFLP